MLNDHPCHPLLAVLKERLPTGVSLAGGLLGDGTVLAEFAEETAAVAQAVDKRRHEFLLGRHHARLALRAVNGPQHAIPMGQDRAPQWPAGFVGSISHSRVFCAAIASAITDYRGLGLDLEADDPLDSGVSAMVLHRLDAVSCGQLDAKLCFVIKEAVYKALYCVTSRFLPFDAVSLLIDPQQQGFVARVHDEISVTLLGQSEFHGSYVRASQHYAAVLAIPASLQA